MAKTFFPKKLNAGDELRVIAPSRSMSLFSKEQRDMSQQRFSEMGLTLSFAQHVQECDDFSSSSIASRVSDLHDAFADPNVKGIITVIGGFNVNSILDHLDYDLIKCNPKILVGYSDITALSNAIYAKTGLVTYSGPHWSTFAMLQGLDFTIEHFKKCLFSDNSFELKPSEHWSDDAWWMDQDNRNFIANPGYTIIQEGEAHGISIGGNLCTFQLLHGTQFLPKLKDAILFLEDTENASIERIDRDLQSLMHQPGFDGVHGIVFGRFQKKSNVSMEQFKAIIHSKEKLKHLPVIANVDFGHTAPYITFPIGGNVYLKAEGNIATLNIKKH